MRMPIYIISICAILALLLFGWSNWLICFGVSILVLLMSVGLWLYCYRRSIRRSGEPADAPGAGQADAREGRHKRRRARGGMAALGSLCPPLLYMLIGGIFLSALICVLPVYGAQLEGSLRGWRSFVYAFHYALQMFSLDAGEDLIESIRCTPAWLTNVYIWYLTAELMIAPVLTVGFVVSFFKNFTGYVRYLIRYFSDAYIFSSLDEKSIALAESIRRKHADALIVFTDVFVRNEETSYEIVERAQKLRAICFKKDILSIDFDHHSERRKMFFFTIGNDETENINQSLKLIERYKWRGSACRLYVFSNRTECELLLNKVDQGDMLVRRIDAVQSMIYQNLYREGVKLFEDARKLHGDGDSGEPIPISVVIVGMGRHCTEMMKALSWYCQMDGYFLRMDVFDKDELAEEKFKALCPGLMTDEYGPTEVDGKACYEIRIHSGIDVTTREFVDEIRKLRGASYVFISLGSDEMNIRMATTLRMLYERMANRPPLPDLDDGREPELMPRIETVIYSANEDRQLERIKNFKGSSYVINFIGDIRSTYSEDVIMNSDLELSAMKVHGNWEDSVEDRQTVARRWKEWKYEYSYRSSCAATLHSIARVKLGLQKPNMSEEEVDRLAMLEHRRWVIYMRSEGYVPSKKYDPNTRNDLAKVHHSLVDWAALSGADQERDRNNVREAG